MILIGGSSSASEKGQYMEHIKQLEEQIEQADKAAVKVTAVRARISKSLRQKCQQGETTQLLLSPALPPPIRQR